MPWSVLGPGYGHQRQRRNSLTGLESNYCQDLNSMHPDLLRDYQQCIEEFSKRYDLLIDIDMRTKLKIKQVSGLRDGVSAIGDASSDDVCGFNVFT